MAGQWRNLLTPLIFFVYVPVHFGSWGRLYIEIEDSMCKKMFYLIKTNRVGLLSGFVNKPSNSKFISKVRTMRRFTAIFTNLRQTSMVVPPGPLKGGGVRCPGTPTPRSAAYDRGHCIASFISRGVPPLSGPQGTFKGVPHGSLIYWTGRQRRGCYLLLIVVAFVRGIFA